MAELVNRLRPEVDLVERSRQLLEARKYLFVARLPESGRPLDLIGYDTGRNRLVVVAAVPRPRALPALVGLLGDRRLARLCRTGQAEAQAHCWRRAKSGRLCCDTVTLTAADFGGPTRGPARGRWAAGV
jgi:hypothetical protein